MKHLKILGLAAVAAMALMAFLGAGTASATVLCKTQMGFTSCYVAGWEYPVTTSVEITQTPATTMVLETTGGVVLDTCVGSTLSGSMTFAGAAIATPQIALAKLEWGACSRTTHTLKLGKLEVHHISETDNGTLTATGGIEVTINTIFGSCVFGTGEALDVGKLTGGNPATINTQKAVIPKISGNAACPAHAVWNAQFTVTSPAPIYVHQD